MNIEKSYIGGGRWVKAAEAAKGTLKVARQNKPHLSKPKVPAADRHYKENQAQTTQAVSGLRSTPFKTKRGPGHLVSVAEGNLCSAMAIAVRTGGRKGGRHMLVDHSIADSKTIAHEKAHLDANRTAFRMHQITQDPKKLIREEARADHISGDTYSKPHKSGYAHAASDPIKGAHMLRVHSAEHGADDPKAKIFTPEHLAEYRKIQDKMTANKGSKKKVSKEFSPWWLGLRSQVSKMNPDPSSVHVLSAGGSGGRKRRGRLKRTTG